MHSASNKLCLAVMAALVIAAVTMRLQRDQARTEFATYRAQVATTNAKAEAAHRATERAMAKDVEWITREHAKTEQNLTLRAVDAGRAVERLRSTIATLNASAPPSSPELAAITFEARTAHDLLGTCSAEYRGVAADADQLSAQVTGLQAFVVAVLSRGD